MSRAPNSFFVHASERDQTTDATSMLRLLTDDLPVLISYVDRQLRYRFVNRAYERWFGQPSEAFIGHTMEEVLGPRAWLALRGYADQALAGETVSYERQVPYETAGTRWIAATYVPHRDAAGGVAGFAVLVSDITQQRQLEQERASALERERAARAEVEAQRNSLHTLLMQVPAAIAIMRAPDLRYVLSNALNQKLAGDRQLVGRTVSEALPQLEAEGLIDILKKVLNTGEPFVASELPLRLDRDEPMYLTGSYQPIRGPGGNVEGVMAFAFEVTEQVRSRRRAEAAEARVRLAVEAAQVGTWDYHPQTKLLTCDGRYLALFGLPPDAEIDSMQLFEAIHPEDRARFEQAVARAFDPSGDGNYEVQYRVQGIQDGIERWVEMRGRAMFDQAGTPTRFLGTGRDMSEQRRMAERNRILAEASAVLGSGLHYRSNLTRIADLAVPQLGDGCAVDMLTAEGQVEQLALAHHDPDELDRIAEFRRRYPPTPGSEWGAWRVLKTGTAVLVPEVLEQHLVEAAQSPDHLQQMRQLAMRSVIMVPLLVREHPIGVLTLFVSRAGRRYGPHDLALAQELARRASVAVENSQLYHAAEVAIQKRDDFVSIASHELRTPLSSLGLDIDGCLRELRRAGDAPDLAKLTGRLERASDQLDRLNQLVDDLLDVSRISAGRLQLSLGRMDLGALTQEVMGRLAEQASKAGCTLNLKVDGTVVGRWDRPRLDEVITNLVVNAIKFGAGKPIEVSVETRTEAQGGGGRLTVQDQGPGVRLEDRQRVFERFERTDEARNVGGIGLGLWIAQQLIHAHSGTIRIEGEPGQGARFVVELPSKPLS